MIRAISILAVSFLILIVSGCANTVNKPTVQQHYLVVSATMSGPIDLNNFRYFVFLKYNASSTAGPNLTGQNSRTLSLPGAIVQASAVDSAVLNPPSLGYIALTCPFDFDEFHEYSNAGKYSGTIVNLVSAPNTSIVVTVNAANIQFSIPLNNASAPTNSNIGINVVTATNAPSAFNIVQDYLDSGISNPTTGGYQLIPATVNYSYSSSVISTPSASPSADIVSWSASII